MKMRIPRLILSLGVATAVLSVLVCLPAWAQTTPSAEDLSGRSITDFSLPSTAGRLASYEGDYYGKHNLILTFFPAAFTPV